MLSEKSQTILTEQFNALPKEIQDSILESNWKEVVHRITEKYSLHIDQGGAMETIVFLTMLGINEPTDFISNLKKEVRITQSLAQAITDEIQEEIFQKIRTDVMERQKNPKEEGVDIISEDGGSQKDLYREDVGDNTSKYVDGQHLDAESILQEVEDHHEETHSDHVDIEIPKEVYFSKDVDIIDDTKKESMTDSEGQTTLDSIREQGIQVASDEQSNKTPDTVETKSNENNHLSIRTLKSDILRQKLANPSWTPEIDKTMTKNTKDIIRSAEKNQPAQPTTINAASGGTPTDDPYRENF